MNKSRSLVKKTIYSVFGESFYQKAYARGKIKDIRAGKNLEHEALWLKHFVHTNSTVLDIGANYGHYTVELAKLAPYGKIYAFEPVPFTFGVLQKIVSHFGIKSAQLFNVAVSDRIGTVLMTIPLLDFGAPNTGVAHVGTSTNADSKSVEVKTVRLDEVELAEPIDFIKIDIEGHEPLAFEGMQHLIKKHQPVVLIEFSHTCLQRAGFDPAVFAQKLQHEFGYRFASGKGEKLHVVNSSTPADGYYFLIPESKMDTFKTLVRA